MAGEGDADKLENIYYGVLSESLLISVLGHESHVVFEWIMAPNLGTLVGLAPEKAKI